MALLQPTQRIVPQAEVVAEAVSSASTVATAQPVAEAEWVETSFTPEADITQLIPDAAHQSLAVTSQATTEVALPATTKSATGAIKSMVDLAGAGFEGLSMGSRSFPIIALKTEGVFEDTEGRNYGKSVRCRMISSRAKTAVQGAKVVNGKGDEQVFFTYDGVVSSNGHLVADLEKAFIEEGRTISRRVYTDVLATLDAPGEEWDQEVIILSVAPTARERLYGRMQILAMQNQWNDAEFAENIGNYTLIAECGAKITSTAQAFYPWGFKFEK
jgi:hypothetical protein